MLAKPPQGSVELWEFQYAGGPGVHPVHVHLVDFQIVSRTGGSRGLAPYESAGLKDIVLLEPGETVQVLAYYGPWNGVYMFHCHNLVHEDHMVSRPGQILVDLRLTRFQMMAAYNVTALEGLGYDNVEGLADPTDSRFAAQWWTQDAYSDSSIQGTLSYLGGLGAYNETDEIKGAISAYYSTNPAAATETGSAAAAANTQPSDNEATQTQGNGFWGHGAAPTQASGSGSTWGNWGKSRGGRWGGK